MQLNVDEALKAYEKFKPNELRHYRGDFRDIMDDLMFHARTLSRDDSRLPAVRAALGLDK